MHAYTLSLFCAVLATSYVGAGRNCWECERRRTGAIDGVQVEDIKKPDADGGGSVDADAPQCLDWTSISIPDSRDAVIGWKSIGNCTCSEAVEALTKHSEAVAAGYSPSCDPNGKFSAKQTFTRVGKMQNTTREWCADTETGTQLDKSVIVKPGVAPLTC